MNDFEYIKDVLSIKTAARYYGLKLNHADMCCCPMHGEKTPSMKIYEKGKNFHCFGCDEHGDVIDLTAKLHGISTFEAAKKLNEDFALGLSIGTYKPPPNAEKRLEYKRQENNTADNIRETDYTDFFRQASENIEKTDYHRGISLDTLKKFHIGFAANWRHPKAPDTVPTSPRLIIPTSKHSYLARDTRADLNDIQKKYAKSKVGNVSLFNAQALKNSKKPIFITEGEIDALSIIDSGGQAIALGSASNVNKLTELLEKYKPDEPLILSLDNDSAGIKAAQTLKENLDKLGIEHYELNISAQCKDCNKAFLTNKGEFAKRVDSAEKIRLIDNCKTVLTAYRSELKRIENSYGSYPKLQENMLKAEKLLSFSGGNEYKLLQNMPLIKDFARELREIMTKGSEVILPRRSITENIQTDKKVTEKRTDNSKGMKRNAR